jgi:hypothetical protein
MPRNEQVAGYDYGTERAARSPLTLEELRRLRETEGADSLDHVPLRYLLAFTAVVVTTARDRLAATGAPAEEVERMHAAFTRSVLLHVTVWSRAYVDGPLW